MSSVANSIADSVSPEPFGSAETVRVRDLRLQDATLRPEPHIQFAKEMLGHHAAIATRYAFFALLVIVAGALVLQEHVSEQFSAIWAGSAFAILVLDWALRRRAGRANAKPSRWTGVLTISALLQGGLWGCALVLLPLTDVAPLTAATLAAPAAFALLNMTFNANALRFAPISFAFAMAGAGYFYWNALPYQETSVAIAVVAILAVHVIGHAFRKNLVARYQLQWERASLADDLTHAEMRLRLAQRLADEASLSKSRFLATMSHELRTPLNAILGFSEMMAQEVLGPMENPRYREYAQDIHGSGAKLLRLIDGILDLSRLEAGRYALEEAPVNLAEIVEEAVRQTQASSREKRLAVLVQVHDDLPCVRVDERAVRQVVMHLLTNAIKFTPEQGSIAVTVGWTRSGGEYVSVRDTGPGISADEQKAVLAPFTQGATAEHAATPGTGLGLAMVRAFMKLHGGAFLFKPSNDQGTHAVAVFPQERVMPGQAGDEACDEACDEIVEEPMAQVA